jgi:D-beta-D-heptose 7-phosphate kinase / D-beta-D-heptose 1-phosphate adenosyltransferase
MYQNLISTFRQFSVLVIGDLILDMYLKGASTRLASEGPVPVVDILSTSIVLGGAANVALNLKQLGAKVSFCSVAGQDENGDAAVKLLGENGINARIIQDKERSTVVKTRVTSGGQLLVRYDSGSESQINSRIEEHFIALLQIIYPQHDAILISDYAKGVLTPNIIKALQLLDKKQKKFIAVDSKNLEKFKTLQPSVVKPNYQEIVRLLGLPIQNSNRIQQITYKKEEILSNTGAQIIAVTMDREGALLFKGTDDIYRCYAHQVAPVQVAGAGDAYISAFTLACMAGSEVSVAGEFASAVAAVAMHNENTAYCTMQELNAYLSINEKIIWDLEHLCHLAAMYRSQGKKIIFTNGCFDILHSGHINYLNRARELGHVLIVGVNTDESVRRIKGKDRPINTLHERLEVLAGLGAVNHIVPFGDVLQDTATPLILAIQPDVFVKGDDHKKETLQEAGLVEQYGGEVILLTLLPDRSTTGIIEKILKLV